MRDSMYQSIVPESDAPAGREAEHDGPKSNNRTPTAVLLHGWPVTTGHWRFLVPALDAAGITAVPVTLPGLGAVPAPEVTDFRKKALADLVRTQLARDGVTRYAVVGHDWGATVGYLMAAAAPDSVTALVVEEEILPGVDIEIPQTGRDHYPTWHGPFNRAAGLAEQLVPGREAAYYGTFLEQSAGPSGLDPAALHAYVDAYSAPGVLESGLAYYRTRTQDIDDVRALADRPIATPVLAIGGRYAMGEAVADGLTTLATDVTPLDAEQSGHYPAEQEPDVVNEIVRFLRQHC
ncbi:alpha/beta fold hydrolase [Streptomyces tirandamycinicus]|uniref:alpha/beta fold hydrolase n=1 Tax=Streptomyces TaxID=1883 RepID=UPI002017020A|nr:MULTISPECIES: alpha/beta hydrolase [Streptomyces]MCY0984172.1 alpha/beta hydrolase [Streptomyces tirandamycinicus]